MSDGIKLKDIRYCGDNPDVGKAYQNAAFRPDSDLEKDGSLKKRQVYTENEKLTEKDASGSTIPVPEEPEGSVRMDYNLDEQSSDDDSGKSCTVLVMVPRSVVVDGWKKHKRYICMAILVVLLILYAIYFVFAMKHEKLQGEPSIRLCWVTCLVAAGLLFKLVWHFCGDRIGVCCKPCARGMAKHETLISWVLILVLFTALLVFVFVDVFVYTKQFYNLVSGAGMLVYVLVFYIFSTNPSKINWRTVVWGLGLQLLFAVIILRWDGGYMAFQWLGDRISEFLLFSDDGAKFVFGDVFMEHFFAFKVLPTIVYFSTVISILYYWGVMQVIVRWVAAVMQFAMGTTAGESLNAAGNIFIGQTEAPLMIRPLLPHMTKSELHAVMTGGFATVAGGVLAAYISFGVPANHLLSASVMSAPAALAMSKLIYPETEKSRTTTKDVKKLPKSKEVNFVAAASNGASQSIALVANVAVNLIAFIALLAFIDSALSWFGERVGRENPPFTFRYICSYLFFPLPFIMGVELHDCRRIAELIGIKTFLNEFIAYVDLGNLISNRATLTNHTLYNGTWFWKDDDIILDPLPGQNGTVTLTNGIISLRSEVIATYALCGFANIGSIGIQLGGLGAMAPERRNDMAQIAVRAMIAGNVACFMTACIAGLFYNGEI